MEYLSEQRLTYILPELAEQIRTLDTLYRAQYPGDYLRVSQGFRKWEDQESLWMEGRDASGNVVNAKEVVTHAPPGHSWHEYGMAVDLVPYSLISLPSFAPDDPKWQWLGAHGESLGLTWGGRWGKPKTDLPHFQLTGQFPVSPNDAVRALYHGGDKDAVWDAAGFKVAPDGQQDA